MKKSWHAHRRVAPKAQRTSRDGIVFHSKTELNRWEYLRLLEKSDQVRNLQRQVKFPLVYKNSAGGITIMAGQKIALYTADFQYDEKIKVPGNQWRTVIEDVKGYRDEASKFRIRVFEALHGVSVRIVRRERGGPWISEESLCNLGNKK